MLVYLFIFDQFAEDISDWVITFNCIMIFYKCKTSEISGVVAPLWIVKNRGEFTCQL